MAERLERIKRESTPDPPLLINRRYGKRQGGVGMGELIIHPSTWAAMEQESDALKRRLENVERLLKEREIDLIGEKARIQELLRHVRTIRDITQESSVRFECDAALGQTHMEGA